MRRQLQSPSSSRFAAADTKKKEKIMKLLSLALVACLFAAPAFADKNHEHPTPVMPKEFDTLKGLVGTWEGTTNMGKGDEKMTVTYELTSGGTAISEKMVSGGTEMLTVYHMAGKKLGLTHFCAVGNSPRMMLKKATDNSLAFEMKGPDGVSSMKENHMHALTLTMKDQNTLMQEWTNMDKGKKTPVTFTLTRK